MNDAQIPDISDYLRSRRRGREFERVPIYEKFLSRVDSFFSLRALAEERFSDHRNTAYRRQGSLPLSWTDIASVLRDANRPPERLIVRIAKARFSDVDGIGRNLRKVLVRVREKAPLGHVQQIDSACLRWLVRKPGRTAIEKAGSDQSILAVVREEQFDTLENRVFKDFLLRATAFASSYLDEWKHRFPAHETVLAVSRFRNLCLSTLAVPALVPVRSLDRFPQPNYVLQQDRRYSRIWNDYAKLVRQESAAERLWQRNDEIEESFQKLSGTWSGWRNTVSAEGGVPLHTNPRAAYETPLWFSEMDGRNPILDLPFWRNARKGEGEHRAECIFPRAGNSVIIDLTGSRIVRNLLVFGPRDNEKPHLQDWSHPNAEQPRAWLTIGQILAWSMGRSVQIPESLPRDKDARTCLREYFEQLRAVADGESWIVLVPDDWPARWLEQLLSAIPMERSRVFLLWRSVAAALGALDSLDAPRAGDSVAVIDGQDDGSAIVTLLDLSETPDGLVPRRKSQRLHPDLFDHFPNRPTPTVNKTFLKPNDHRPVVSSQFAINALSFAKSAHHLVLTGTFALTSVSKGQRHDVVHGEEFLEHGCRLFVQKRNAGRIPYFDELEGLFLVIRKKAGIEDIAEAVALIEPNDCFPGGQECIGRENRDFSLDARQDTVRLYLSEQQPTRTSPLKLSLTTLPDPTETPERLVIHSRVTPGQGLAVCSFDFESGNLERPIRLDLSEMKDPAPAEPKNIQEIEQRLPRSFPPDIPCVEASEELFGFVRDRLCDYVSGAASLRGDELAKARYVLLTRPLPSRPDAVVYDPRIHSPIDRLRRENVFGNTKGKSVPHDSVQPGLFSSVEFEPSVFFRRLAKNYGEAVRNRNNAERLKVVRLVAWTYQADNILFNDLKGTLLRQYKKAELASSPHFSPQEYTALANLFDDADSLKQLISIAGNRISLAVRHPTVSWSHDVRLLYNLLQFHPNALRMFETRSCEKLMDALERLYSSTPTQRGPILRTMLFLLNRRRFDSGFYQRNWEESSPPNWISKPAPTPKLDGLRLAFIAYVCGKGTLDGLPRDED